MTVMFRTACVGKYCDTLSVVMRILENANVSDGGPN